MRYRVRYAVRWYDSYHKVHGENEHEWFISDDDNGEELGRIVAQLISRKARIVSVDMIPVWEPMRV